MQCDCSIAGYSSPNSVSDYLLELFKRLRFINSRRIVEWASVHAFGIKYVHLSGVPAPPLKPEGASAKRSHPNPTNWDSASLDSLSG